MKMDEVSVNPTNNNTMGTFPFTPSGVDLCVVSHTWTLKQAFLCSGGILQARDHNVPRFQSTTFFSCSRVRKMRMVVGWRRDHAGSQPLNMNIGPSVANELRITPIVDLNKVSAIRGQSISRIMTHAGSGSRSIHDTAL
jgi:hypothetical protein